MDNGSTCLVTDPRRGEQEARTEIARNYRELARVFEEEAILATTTARRRQLTGMAAHYQNVAQKITRTTSEAGATQ